MVFAATGANTARLLLELGAVILACGLLARLAGWLSISPIPFYLGVGLVINEAGPLALRPSFEFIEAGAAIGVVLLLFTLGLEYTPRELVDGLKSNSAGGALDLVMNAGPGALAGFVLGFDLPQTLALAGVTYISSSGIVAKLLRDLGRTGNRETPVILSVLVIEDLVMALYLPLLAGVLAGGGTANVIASIAVALVMVIVVFVATLLGGETISRLLFARSTEALLLTVLGLTLVVAGIAESVNVSAAVGAFLVGIALSGKAAERAAPLLNPLRDVFATAFFLFFAIQIDLGQLPRAIVPALALAVLTGATKVATGYWTAQRGAIGARGRWRTGLTLIARGEFSIVIAGLAVAAQPSSKIGALTAAYVLLLAVVGPILARFSDPIIGALASRTATAARVDA